MSTGSYLLTASKLAGMAQPNKGPRVLAGPRLAQEVYETVKEVAPPRFIGPYVADLVALLFGFPDRVTDWHTVGALLTSRAVYDGVLEEAADRNISPVDLVNTLIAEGLGRPELLETPQMPEQEVLPFGDEAAA